MTHLKLFLCSALLAPSLSACSGNKEDAEAQAEALAKSLEKGLDEALDTSKKAADDAEKKVVAYSKEAAAKLIAQLDTCEYDFSCDAFKPLVAFGEPAHEALLAYALDASKAGKSRAIAVSALVKGNAKGVALKLHALAKTNKDFSLKRALYKAVGTLGAGDNAVFEALKAEYSEEGADQVQVRSALSKFPEKTVAWATEAFGKDPKAEVDMADLIGDAATKTQLPQINALLESAKNQMAKHRLARTAIKLGDKRHFGIFVAGLKSADQYDRSDAANFLADVVKQLPAELKAETIELLKAAQGKDRGGLTARGYAKCLKVLTAG